MSLLAWEGVSFAWPGGAGLQEVTAAVGPGAFVVLEGASGAGKSTLLRLAAWLEVPQKGVMRLRGRPYQALGAACVRREIGFLPQTPPVLPGSVRDNLLAPFCLAAMRDKKAPDDATLAACLARLDLPADLAREAAALSVGQQQRLGLIRAVLRAPALLLLDEPVSALDAASRRRVEGWLDELNAGGMAIVMVTHAAFAPTRPVRRLVVEHGRVREG